MTEIALVVLLDAFRPDYLHRTRFLRRLANRSGTGEMEEPFGFVPRSAYFGGLTPDETRYSNIFALEPARSPFPVVPCLRRLLPIVNEAGLRERLTAEARRRVPDFGARYTDAFRVPTEMLATLAITEVESPWAREAGYRSLFHILDDHGIRWTQCAWPYTRTVQTVDPGIIGSFVSQWTDDTRFGYVHLSQLDAVGHVHGPGSRELQRALDETDKLCECLLASALERYDRVQLLVFGDHGMVTVVRKVDLLGLLQSVPETRAGDFTVFLDSPMARFWFHTRTARERVTRFLGGLDCGNVLTDDVLDRFWAASTNRGNGELFFMAHPGVVFSPNYFQTADEEVKGMHGYLPSVPDNRGLLLLHDSSSRVSGSLGIADARRLFPTCLRMCGLNPPEFTELPPLLVTPDPPAWTVMGGSACEARVAQDIGTAARIIAERAPASTVVVAGSFGRGEGCAVTGASGTRILNDYDFVVLGPDSSRCQDPPLGPALAQRLGTDFCDVLSMGAPESLPASQFHFDLKYGAKIVIGDPLVLDRIPSFAPADVKPDDAMLQLLNRAAGVCLVPLRQQSGKEGPLNQFAVNQLVKAWLAVADAHLVGCRDYAWTYRRRQQRFMALARGLELDDVVVNCVMRALEYRLHPVAPPGAFVSDDFAALRPAFNVAFSRLANGDPERGRARAVEMAVAPVTDPDDDDRRARAKLATLGWTVSGTGVAPGAFTRRTILEGIQHVFFAGTDVWSRGSELAAACEKATILGTGLHDAAGAESIREALACAWLKVCH